MCARCLGDVSVNALATIVAEKQAGADTAAHGYTAPQWPLDLPV